MKISISKSALKGAGGSAAVALQRAGVPMSSVHVSPSGGVTVRPRQGSRSAPARGRPGGAMRPAKGRGSYNRAKGKAV